MERGKDTYGIESIAESAMIEMITDPIKVENVRSLYKGNTLRFK